MPHSVLSESRTPASERRGEGSGQGSRALGGAGARRDPLGGGPAWGRLFLHMRPGDGGVASRQIRLAIGDGRGHRRCDLGSRASFSPSPTRLTPNTVMNTARPGGITVHHASIAKSRLRPIIEPQLIALGSVRPRKESPASNRIAAPTVSVDATMRGGSALGRMTRQIRRRSEAPTARDAVT